VHQTASIVMAMLDLQQCSNDVLNTANLGMCSSGQCFLQPLSWVPMRWAKNVPVAIISTNIRVRQQTSLGVCRTWTAN